MARFFRSSCSCFCFDITPSFSLAICARRFFTFSSPLRAFGFSSAVACSNMESRMIESDWSSSGAACDCPFRSESWTE